MLAYNEKNRLKEFEDVCNLQACTHCRKIYRQVINDQIPGFREREHDICPYCGTRMVVACLMNLVTQK